MTWGPASLKAAVEAPRRVLSSRVEMVDLSGASIMTLPVESATVDFRGEQAEQWACSLNLTDPRAVPKSFRDPLDPRSLLRARLWWRIQTATGWAEVPCGTYVLEDPDITADSAGVGITVTGRDPLAQARDNGYGATVLAVGGMTVPAALRKIFGLVAPQTPLQIADSTTTLPALYELAERDPAKDWTEIADMAGWVVRTDRMGTIVAGPRPEPTDVAALWNEGPDCAVVSLRRGIASGSLPNRVVVTSTSPDVAPPIVGIAEDDDPGSPTWIGRWGPYSRNITSDVIATQAGADALARMQLGRLRAPQETVTVRVPARPDLEYRELISLGSERAGVGGTYRVSGWKLSLAADGVAPPLMEVTMMQRAIA